MTHPYIMYSETIFLYFDCFGLYDRIYQNGRSSASSLVSAN